MAHSANLTIIRDCRKYCCTVTLQHWIEIISHIVKVNPFDCCKKRLPVKEAAFNFAQLVDFQLFNTFQNSACGDFGKVNNLIFN